MDTDTLIGPNRLLEHPFYRRWESGDLAEGELARYAEQYRHFEAMLPGFLAGLESVVDAHAAQLVAANLADEVDGPTTHLTLFEGFATAVGAHAEAAPTPAMAALVAVYTDALAQRDAAYGLGVLLGYEVQAAEVASSKAAALGACYGVDAEGCTFWETHAHLEELHAAWSLEASEGLDEARLLVGAEASASAWWGFLDEREALAAA
jgi:pyrroloquinoline-quinone synthase